MSGILSCSAMNCVNNVNGLCSAYKIHVGGMKAITSKETQCKTFAEKGFISGLANLGNMNLPGEIRQLFSNEVISMTPQIACEAVKCVYNSDRICSAAKIQIMGNSANSSEETQCETFID